MPFADREFGLELLLTALSEIYARGRDILRIPDLQSYVRNIAIPFFGKYVSSAGLAVSLGFCKTIYFTFNQWLYLFAKFIFKKKVINATRAHVKSIFCLNDEYDALVSEVRIVQ